MFAPSLKLTNIILENGGKLLTVANPHIDTDQERSTQTGDTRNYDLTVNFSLTDQYNDSGIGSWIENEDLRKYIKINISYYKSTTIVNKYIELTQQNNLNLINYLKVDDSGNRYYEYPISYKIEPFSKDIKKQILNIKTYFDLKNYIFDKGLPNTNIENEFGDPLEISIIKDYNIVNSSKIINNSIIEDIEKKLINTVFTSDLENKLISIIEKDQKNLDISTYFTDLYISKNEANQNHLLFGIDKKKIIQTKTQFGNYVDNLLLPPSLRQAILNNIFINNIKLIKKQVKKVVSVNKLDQKTEDYVDLDNTIPIFLTLDESNLIDINSNSDYEFYNILDSTNSNAPENSFFQYSISLSLQDTFNQVIFNLYKKLLTDIKVLESYYQIISIPFVDEKLVSDNNPHISNSIYESTKISKSYGYYDVKTNTFKNIRSDTVPDLESICSNFSSLYFLVYSINKQNLEDVYSQSIKIKDELKKSLFANSTGDTSTLYIISKSIELIKSFSLLVEKVFNFKIIDIDAQTDANNNLKIGSSTNNIIDLSYVFQNVVNNNYFNNFKRNKFLFFQPNNITYYPTINSSNLASFLTTSNAVLQPISNSSVNIIYDEFISLNNSTNLDSKEARLLFSFLNNYLIYLKTNNLNHIDFSSNEEYKMSIYPSDYLKPYKSLTLDILNYKNLDVSSFKVKTILEVVRDPIPNEPPSTSRDPLNYNLSNPRETFTNVPVLNDVLLDNKKHESIDRLLTYILSSLNDEVNLTINYDDYAKKDVDLSNIINNYLPKFNIEYLSGFDNSIKNSLWGTLSVSSFNTFPIRSKILCRLTPIVENTSYELKNIINNLQVPYMYFIIIKNTTQFSSTNSIVDTSTLRNRPRIVDSNTFLIEPESSIPQINRNAPLAGLRAETTEAEKRELFNNRPRITRR